MDSFDLIVLILPFLMFGLYALIIGTLIYLIYRWVTDNSPQSNSFQNPNGIGQLIRTPYAMSPSPIAFTYTGQLYRNGEPVSDVQLPVESTTRSTRGNITPNSSYRSSNRSLNSDNLSPRDNMSLNSRNLSPQRYMILNSRNLSPQSNMSLNSNNVSSQSNMSLNSNKVLPRVNMARNIVTSRANMSRNMSNGNLTASPTRANMSRNMSNGNLTASPTRANVSRNSQPTVSTNKVINRSEPTSDRSCKPVIDFTGVVPSQTRGLTRDEQESIVTAHNKYRALHGVGPLQYDTNLGQNAQSWADQLASQGCNLQHQPGLSGQGENLAYYYNIKGNTLSPVEAWYSERCDYELLGDYNTPTDNNARIGHFTQLVWKDSTKVGCGYATCPNNKQAWVCRYSPQGNFVVRQANESLPNARTRVYRQQVRPPKE